MEMSSEVRKEVVNCIMRDLRRVEVRKDWKYQYHDIIKKLVTKVDGTTGEVYREFSDNIPLRVSKRKVYRMSHDKLAPRILDYLENSQTSNSFINKDRNKKAVFDELIEEKNYFLKLVNEARKIVSDRKNRLFKEIPKKIKDSSLVL